MKALPRLDAALARFEALAKTAPWGHRGYRLRSCALVSFREILDPPAWREGG